MKKTLCCLALSSLPVMSYANSPYFSLKDGDGFKRFSVSGRCAARYAAR